MDFLSSHAIEVLDRMVQWLIIPAIAFGWALNKRVSLHESEIQRIVTILEERERHRDRDRAADREVIRELKGAIDKLNDRLDHIVEKGK
jgi:hypothetical protein